MIMHAYSCLFRMCVVNVAAIYTHTLVLDKHSEPQNCKLFDGYLSWKIIIPSPHGTAAREVTSLCAELSTVKWQPQNLHVIYTKLTIRSWKCVTLYLEPK